MSVTRTLLMMMAVMLALPAAAQQGGGPGGGGPRVLAEGDDGFSLSEDGRSRLHVGVTAGTGFDTNPYTTPLANPEFGGDVVVRIRPYVNVNAPGSTLAFSGVAQLDYGFLPGLISPDTQSFLLYQALVGADLELNRGGAFSFAVGDSVSWNTDPGVVVLGSLLSRVRNRLQAGVGFRPGGGTLNTRLQYTFDFTKFIDIQGSGGIIADGVLDSMNHNLQLRADYRFLPKTGVFGAIRAGWQTYPFTNTQPQAFPVTINAGLQGNLLPKLAFLVSAGYSNPFVIDNTGLVTGAIVGVVGQAEAQWQLGPQTKVAGGFRRTFEPIALYQYIGDNRFYARFGQTLGQFELALRAGYGALEFGEEQAGNLALTDTPIGRFDHAVDGSIALNFHVTRWFAFGIINTTDWRATNASDVSDPITPINLSYFRNETLLIASAKY
jgi:hypothetical protein